MTPSLNRPLAAGWTRPRALLALAALTSAPACRRAAAPSTTDGAIESAGTWAGLRVRTVGERQDPRQVVILLHGWGAPGDDLVPLGEALSAPGRLLVFPEGPLVSQGGGRAWWQLDLARLQAAQGAVGRGRGEEFRSDIPAGLPDARAKLIAFITEVTRRARVAPQAVVIGGFSQGAMLSTDVVLAAPGAVGGLVVLSGSFIAEPVWTSRLAALPEGFPIFMSHGRMDPVLPFAFAETLRDRFQAAHHAVTWVPFAGGHGIPQVVLSELQTFLGARSSPGAAVPGAAQH